MPTYCSITIQLISQYGLYAIPEFTPPAEPSDPFYDAPTLQRDELSLTSVYVPTYPGSQFWIKYEILPPFPPKQQFYFKLYINGDCKVSWGCGEEQGYKGKTMFVLYEHAQSNSTERLIERRVLCWGPDPVETRKSTEVNHNDVMEIRVFRSRSRKRTVPKVEQFSAAAIHQDPYDQTRTSINLVNAGILPAKQPLRFYEFHLLDPLEQPFATFRYYYRTWEHLVDMGIVDQPTVEHQSSPEGSGNVVESPVSMWSDSEDDDDGDDDDDDNASSTHTIRHKSFTLSKGNADTQGMVASSSTSSFTQDKDFGSPLRARISSPPALDRPSTPPPRTTPPKTPQLPFALRPSDSTLSTPASKDSFASLVRTHLPDTDPSTFQLHDLPEETILRPPSPPRLRSKSVAKALSAFNVAATPKIRRNSDEGPSSSQGPTTFRPMDRQNVEEGTSDEEVLTKIDENIPSQTPKPQKIAPPITTQKDWPLMANNRMSYIFSNHIPDRSSSESGTSSKTSEATVRIHGTEIETSIWSPSSQERKRSNKLQKSHIRRSRSLRGISVDSTRSMGSGSPASPLQHIVNKEISKDRQILGPVSPWQGPSSPKERQILGRETEKERKALKKAADMEMLTKNLRRQLWAKIP